jgi:hypothetical protein
VRSSKDRLQPEKVKKKEKEHIKSTLQNPAVTARITPKTTTIVYWIVTALFCLEMSP